MEGIQQESNNTPLNVLCRVMETLTVNGNCSIKESEVFRAIEYLYQKISLIIKEEMSPASLEHFQTVFHSAKFQTYSFKNFSVSLPDPVFVIFDKAHLLLL